MEFALLDANQLWVLEQHVQFLRACKPTKKLAPPALTHYCTHDGSATARIYRLPTIMRESVLGARHTRTEGVVVVVKTGRSVQLRYVVPMAKNESSTTDKLRRYVMTE